ncbi:AMP-dependent synthetase and ligase family protein [Tripterygium wilfordii]|uniref:AMP-dependent synthetase and ligase family protein n=1 Tax=Tripterygium wilfordii TaxID=458696 RepID=A0A7J7CUE6_TRIWF|nr:trans-cinnamate:CoA ligase, peroxisomal-like [Tripterygium wilfordii]KAF5737717.1 AMP-dependent synthetase and ligase family protein [Tripterygium wilfordii]
MDYLPKCEANYTPLTPMTFLKRAAMAYANRTSVIHESTFFTWSETYRRCRCLASSLISLKIAKNNVVSVLAPNIPAMYEMHFAVPMAGAVLNTINTRLDAKNVATILRHSEAKIFFVDYQFVPVAREALGILMAESVRIPAVVVIDDINTPTGLRLGALEYEQLINKGDSNFVPLEIEDEWDPIALNYTSGTTSEPKGVVYSHRGAYLSTLSLILGWEMGTEAVYLWSLPMFHCNGWTFTWGVAARGGTNVCIRNTTAYDMYRNIALHKVTHMCCAPIVFNILLDAKPEERSELTSPVQILTGGAPPPASLLQKIEQLGFQVTHAYGLTEATGPALVCEWQARWNRLPIEDQAKIKARQGLSVLTLSDVDVKDADTMASVPRDGKTIGEIVLKGSSIMKGYLKDEEATAKAFKNGWFFTGDVGVIHPDGYLEIKDRSKDVIISGGENISSVELENVLYKHPRVLEAAVVAMPHPLYGESPCAFIAVKKNQTSGKTDDVSEGEIVAYCRKNLPSFMVPKKVEFMAQLPKTSTNKIQKFQLRALAETFIISDEKNTSRQPRQQLRNPPLSRL